MKIDAVRHFRPGFERLETREVPAFLAPISSPGGGDLISVADFNVDGRDDVAVLRNKNVLVSLSNGDGTFRQVSTLGGATGPIWFIDISDYNGDGKLDVQASGGKPDGWVSFFGERVRTYTVYVNRWLGNGDGTFGPVATTSSRHAIMGSGGIYNPTTAYADFNRDGVTDSASVGGVYASLNLVAVFLVNPDGTNQPLQTYAAGSSPGSIAVGDFNGDGWTDIVVVNSLTSREPTLSVLPNNGNW